MEKIDATVKKINELARKIAAKRNQDGKSVFLLCPRETGEVWTMLSNRFHPEYFSYGKEKAFFKAIEKSLQEYSPDKGEFMVLFSKVFKNKCIDEYRKSENKEELNVLLSEPIGDKENDTQGELEDTIADKSAGVEENVISRIDLENKYRLIADICIEKKKTPKKTICYPPLFFTDNIVYNVFNTKAFDEIVQENANKFDEAVSNDFLNTLLTGKCGSMADISNFDCRPLSDFTSNPKDAETPCCNGNPNYKVFNDFLKKSRGNGIFQSEFSKQKKLYFALISSVLGITPPGKKKRS